MKVSIVTPTYNSERTVKDTLDSVYCQTVVDKEHLIADGASTDGTLKVCGTHPSKPAVISEPDKGIYDAMNKGIARADGEVVHILNSDDFYFDDRVLQKVNDAFAKCGADVVYGNVIYVDAQDISKMKRLWRPGTVEKWKLWLGWTVPHPAVFVKRDVYKKTDVFDLSFPVCADYDFLTRAMLRADIHWHHVDAPLVFMRTGGASDAEFSKRFSHMHQVCLAFKKNTGVYPFWFYLTRPLIKLHQLLV